MTDGQTDGRAIAIQWFSYARFSLRNQQKISVKFTYLLPQMLKTYWIYLILLFLILFLIFQFLTWLFRDFVVPDLAVPDFAVPSFAVPGFALPVAELPKQSMQLGDVTEMPVHYAKYR